MPLAPLFPIAHRALKPLFPDCLWQGNQDLPTVALTFDDGPHSQYTPQLLRVLDRYRIPASFFWLGTCVKRSPTIAKAVYDRGHWIGLHGYDHRSFASLSSAALQQTLEQTRIEITEACQISPEAICDVRPPNGLFTPKTLNLLHQWNYRPVMWSVVPEDWVRPGVATVVERVLQQVKNGSLIVLHDGDCGGADIADITNQLVPILLRRNYRFVTVNEFWHNRHFLSL